MNQEYQLTCRSVVLAGEVKQDAVIRSDWGFYTLLDHRAFPYLLPGLGTGSTYHDFHVLDVGQSS